MTNLKHLLSVTAIVLCATGAAARWLSRPASDTFT